MKLLCDVHIPFKLVKLLTELGYESKHVNELPDKWFTKDQDICKYCDEHNYVVITKDKDFKDSYLIKREPKKLIKINLGNVSTSDLLSVFNEHIASIASLERVKNTFLCEIGLSGTNWIE